MCNVHFHFESFQSIHLFSRSLFACVCVWVERREFDASTWLNTFSSVWVHFDFVMIAILTASSQFVRGGNSIYKISHVTKYHASAHSALQCIKYNNVSFRVFVLCVEWKEGKIDSHTHTHIWNAKVPSNKNTESNRKRKYLKIAHTQKPTHTLTQHIYVVRKLVHVYDCDIRFALQW